MQKCNFIENNVKLNKITKKKHWIHENCKKVLELRRGVGLPELKNSILHNEFNEEIDRFSKVIFLRETPGSREIWKRDKENQSKYK